MIETAIVTILSGDSGVTDLVGSNIIVDRLPQPDESPAIVLWVDRERALDALDGPLGMDQPLLRVASYGNTRTVASILRSEVRRVLGGFMGVVDGLYIKGIAQEPQRGQTQTTDRVSAGSDQYRYVSYQDFRVSYDYAQATP